MNEELVRDYMSRSSSVLHESISKYVSEIKSLEEDKKTYVSGIRDAIKELNDRIETALAVLKKKKDGQE